MSIIDENIEQLNESIETLEKKINRLKLKKITDEIGDLLLASREKDLKTLVQSSFGKPFLDSMYNYDEISFFWDHELLQNVLVLHPEENSMYGVYFKDDSLDAIEELLEVFDIVKWQASGAVSVTYTRGGKVMWKSVDQTVKPRLLVGNQAVLDDIIRRQEEFPYKKIDSFREDKS